jgi:predicted RNase H-like HicB family nuclease
MGVIVTFAVIVQPDRDGGFSVVCPAVPGGVSQGDSLPPAAASIREAIAHGLVVRHDQALLPVVETPETGDDRRRGQDLSGRSSGRRPSPLTIETREVHLAVDVPTG